MFDKNKKKELDIRVISELKKHLRISLEDLREVSGGGDTREEYSTDKQIIELSIFGSRFFND